MDSLTQIVLGAACGEAVLGKKVGNRAMLWGAVGGTIPDLDVLANFMLTDMQALAFHRGISHSFLFAATTPFLFGWLVNKLYQSGRYQNKYYKLLVFLSTLLFLVLAVFILNLATVVISGSLSYLILAGSVGLSIWGLIYLFGSYLSRDLEPINATQSDWTKVFFWSILTHPILDTFTAYGTQLFAPFSSYRVAFNTISVADPLYTIPFLLCLIGASFIKRNRPMRRYLNYLGILLSSAYLMFTVFNKKRVDRVFEKSLQAENINFERFRTGPSIFNNILWQGVAETSDGYYYGTYSLLDKQAKVFRFYNTPKNHDLIDAYREDSDIQTLKWFTDGYFTVTPMRGDTLQIGDLRYGTTRERPAEPQDYVFKFSIVPDLNGGVNASEARDFDDRSDAFSELWDRMKGK